MDTLNWLLSFSGVSLPILIITITAVLLYLIFGLVTGKGMHLQLGKIKFSVGLGNQPKDNTEDEKINTKENTTSERKCVLCKFRVSESMKHTTNSIRDLKLELLDRQMKSIENMSLRVSHTLINDYLVFLQKHITDRKIDMKYWEIRLVSEKIQRSFYQHLIPGLRQMLKENHLASRGDSEFDDYKKVSISTMRAGVMAFVDSEYIDEYSVSREEKGKFFGDAYDSVVASAIRYELDSSRTLAKIYDADILKLEDKLKALIEDVPLSL